MLGDRCKVLLIEDNPEDISLIEQLLSQSDRCSLVQGSSFLLSSAQSLAQGIAKLTTEEWDIVLLDLILPDSKGVNSLIEIRQQVPKVPIIVQVDNADETLIVRAFQLGADGYLQKNNLDSNLLAYEIRLAIERQQYRATLDRFQQEQEFQDLRQFANSLNTNITARMFGAEPLQESLPEIFAELVHNYGNLLDLALEQRAYKVEHNIAEGVRNLANKLGFLKASPRDVVDIHTITLRGKTQDGKLAKAQAYVAEGRLMVLELMGYLTSFYRKYYIGLSNINLSSQSDRMNQ